MPDPFQTIQQTVSAREVAEHYGINVNPRGWALCPFHNERTPSLHFRGARYYCFGCGASGDATDLVRELFGMTYAEAARRISDDFNLGLDFGTPATPEQREKAKQAAAEREAVKKLKAQFDQWRIDTMDKLDELIRIANKADYSNLSDKEVEIIKKKEFLEYLDDILLSGKDDEQFELYKSRDGVKTLLTNLSGKTSSSFPRRPIRQTGGLPHSSKR